VFERLHRIAEPLFYGHELASHHAEVTEWLRHGLLQRAGSADEIPGPSDETLSVTRTVVGWIGTDEETGDTHVLTDDDVATYRVSLPALLDLIRARSGIVGTGSPRNGSLRALGAVELAGGIEAAVFLACPAMTEDAMVAMCAPFADNVTPVVVATLQPVALSLDCQRKFEQWRIVFAHVDEAIRIRFLGGTTEGRTGRKMDPALIYRGRTWDVRFQGMEKSVLDSKGVRYIAFLAKHAGVVFSPFDLHRFEMPQQAISLDAVVAAFGQQHHKADRAYSIKQSVDDSVIRLDPEVVAHYRPKISHYRQAIKEADEADRRTEAEELRTALAELQAEMVGAISREEKRSPVALNRKRDAVSKAIVRAYPEIKKHLPEAEAYLRPAISTGNSFCFCRAPRESWYVEMP